MWSSHVFQHITLERWENDKWALGGKINVKKSWVYKCIICPVQEPGKADNPLSGESQTPQLDKFQPSGKTRGTNGDYPRRMYMGQNDKSRGKRKSLALFTGSSLDSWGPSSASNRTLPYYPQDTSVPLPHQALCQPFPLYYFLLRFSQDVVSSDPGGTAMWLLCAPPALHLLLSWVFATLVDLAVCHGVGIPWFGVVGMGRSQAFSLQIPTSHIRVLAHRTSLGSRNHPLPQGPEDALECSAFVPIG